MIPQEEAARLRSLVEKYDLDFAKLQEMLEEPIMLSTETNSIATKKVSSKTDPNVIEYEEKKNESPNEKLIEQSELVPVHFLEEGALVQKAVARVKISRRSFGTGFLVSPSLLLTNNHVLGSKDAAAGAKIQFNYQLDFSGKELQIESYSTEPNNFFHTNSNLDYSLVRIGSGALSSQQIETGPRLSYSLSRLLLGTGDAGYREYMLPGDRWGFIPLRTKKIAVEQLCNIIQHPKGRRKEVALHDNSITEIYENVIRYRTDTEPGSSGSPVFDNEWDLIALHHSAGKQEDNIWLSNEGIRMDVIISDLKKYLKGTQNGPSVAQDLGLDLS